MNELFRFIEQAYPAPVAAEPGFQLGGEDTTLQKDLLQLRAGDSPASKMADRAEEFLKSDIFPSNIASLHFGSKALDGWQRLQATMRNAAGVPSLVDFIKQLFGAAPADLLTRNEFQSDRQRLDDALLAFKFSRIRSSIDSTPYARARRMLALVQVAAAGKNGLSSDELNAVMRRSFLVDSRLLPIPADPQLMTSEPTPPQGEDPFQQLARRSAALRETWQMLMAIEPQDIDIGTRSSQVRREESGLHERNRSKRSSVATERGFYLTADSLHRVSSNVRTALADLQINPRETTLSHLTEKVNARLVETSTALRPHLLPAWTRVYRVGMHLFALKPETPAAPIPAVPKIPLLHPAALIKPMLVGNLQVVRQELIGYEAGEVSHVENILRGETFERKTERQESSETTTIFETETTKTQERDAQSTERNELGSEAQNASTDGQGSAAAQMKSSSYGNLVENRQSQYGKEVTDKAVNNVTNRVKEQRTQREQKLFVETINHNFSNKDGTTNIRGVYQWLDKKLKVHVFNYGQRLLYDVVVPEPAAFFLDSLKSSQQSEANNFVKPEPPSRQTFLHAFGFSMHAPLAPTDLDATNYLEYARIYGATASVEPPPLEFKTVVWTCSGQGQVVHRAEKITIPEGYAALVGYFQNTDFFDENGAYVNGQVEITIGEGYHFDLNIIWDRFDMQGETGELPITFAGGGMKGWDVAVGILCKNATAYRGWQIKIFNAIIEGYKKQLADYEQRLAALQTMMRTQLLLAQNSDRDGTLERTELKKAFIQLLMSEYFSKVSFPTPDPTAFPKDVNQTKQWGAVVAFFERAFEWDNLMYYCYPYYWGRRERWAELVLIQDLDPQFEAFLKAGAARVVVPVRPGFEGAIAHYQETGDIWFGKEMPEMFSEMYVSIVDEITHRNAAFGQEKCVQEWDVKLPTALVVVRDETTLPEWTSTIKCEPDPDV